MRLFNLRVINNNSETLGITIDKRLEVFFPIGTKFTQMKSGTAIILTSGAEVPYTKEEIKKYEYEDMHPKR